MQQHCGQAPFKTVTAIRLLRTGRQTIFSRVSFDKVPVACLSNIASYLGSRVAALLGGVRGLPPQESRRRCKMLVAEGAPDFPICGQSGPRFPFPAESGNGGSPFSGPGRIGKREFPPRFPAKSGIGGTGIEDFRVWARAGPWARPWAS